MPPDPPTIARLVCEIARSAGDLLLERFAGPARGVATKSSSTDMVSDADRASEALIIDAISTSRPDDTIVGEESGAHAGAGALTWIVDPLDGTTNFLYGHRAWAVSIAVQEGDHEHAAAVYAPLDDEMFAAAAGEGTTLNGAPIRVSDKADLATALIATGFTYDAALRGTQGRVVAEVLPQVRDVRRGGSAALDLAWVAAGRIDGYYERHLGLWDLAAGSMLVSEAGGTVRPLVEPPDPVGVGAVAAGPAIIDSLADLVGSAL